MFRKRVILDNEDDAALVMHSLGGNRDAFGEIVSRYQNLLCSLAYSSVGDIKQSEDIAQEAFIDAWVKLDTLRDPEKLKSWLCGILRFKVSHFRRRESKHIDDTTKDISETTESCNAVTPLDEEAIQQQHQSLMWSVLNNMETTYREPLILFYREQQSVERVAAELELSEDTVKQRLSRGRKMLKAAMSSFVEESLKNSKPGVAFTVAVVSAIGAIAPPAKAAAYGTGVAKAGSFFKFTALLTLLASFSGLISTFLGLQAGMAQTRTQNERKLLFKIVGAFVVSALIYVLGMFVLKELALANSNAAFVFALISQVLVTLFVCVYFWLVYRMVHSMKQLRAFERKYNPQAFSDSASQVGSKQREYISKWRLFGVPLCHFQFGMPEYGDKPAYGWVAGGTHAYGLLFAWGGVAIAPISVGIISVGVITVGAVGVGIFGMGTVAFGVIAFGASAIGYKAYASLSSVGLESAFSQGFSFANQAAIGPIAIGEHTNNDIAAQLAQLSLLNIHYHWFLAAIAVLVIVPAALHAYTVRKRMKV